MEDKQKNFYARSEAYFKALSAAGEDYFQEYLSFVKHYIPAGAKLLDAGCGTGQSTNLLHEAGYAASGLDGTERFIQAARQTFPSLDFRVGDLESLEFSNQNFEAVAAYNTLECVDDVPAVLAEMLRVIKNGGLLLIQSPNLMSVRRASDAFGKRFGTTFEGVKTRPQLVKMMLRNIAWILKRTISSRADFKYREPDYDASLRGHDANVYLSPLDIKHCLESLGAKIICYQEIRHLPNASVLKIVGSRFFADHMGVIRIVARKGARFERQ